MSAVPFWMPSEPEVEAAEMTKFRLYVNKRYGLSLSDYWELWKWSTGTPEEMNDFWTSVWDFTGIIGDQGPAPVGQSPISMLAFFPRSRLTLLGFGPRQLFNANVPIYETRRFCTNARVNWAENMLLGHSLARSKHTALISLIEPLEANASRAEQAQQAFIRSLTFEELYIEVAQAASALENLGVKPGDRVAAVSSNNAGKTHL